MGNLFNYDSKFIRSVNRIVDSFLLGLIWLVCCIPVFTVGAASTAFYYAFNKAIIQEKGYPFREFFHGFRTNFRQSTILWLIHLSLLVILFLDLYILSSDVLPIGILAPFLLIVSLLILVLTVGWMLCGFPYIARFENGWKTQIKNSFILTLANLHWAILLILILAGAVFLILRFPVLYLFAPAIYIFCANKILERIFQKYTAPEVWDAQFDS